MKRHSSRSIVAALALTLLAAGGLTACSREADPKGSAATGRTSPAKPGATADPAQNGANEIGIDQPDPSKAIFSKQFAIPGKSQRKVTVGILSLERKGQLLILKVVMTPEFADLAGDETIGVERALGQDGIFWTPTLLDLKNLKKYTVPYVSGHWLNGQDGEAVSGQPIYAWATFAQPPAQVTNVDLSITPWMPRFTNVPIR